MTKEEELLNWKAGEYAGDEDRLQNFHQAALLECRRPAQVALSYLLKHMLAIIKAVITSRCAWAWEIEGGEGLKQRIADARNYLLLLAACLDEESGNTSEG